MQDVLTPLSAEKIMGSLYSAETSSIRYIAVVKKSSTKGITGTDLPKDDTKKAEKVTRPSQVKNKRKTKANLTWKKVTGAKGYQVQYSMKKKFPARKTKKKNAAKRTVTISRLKKKKTYYFRVRAYKKKANGSKVYGKWSKVKKVKIRK